MEEKSEKQKEKELKKEYKRMKKTNHPRTRTLKISLFALLMGVIVGFGGFYAIQNNFSNLPGGKAEPVNVSVVFDRVMEQNELVTASQKYQVVEKVRDASTFFDLFEIPFTENSFWYRYVGTIKAAVDLSKAELVIQDGTTITISLEEPYISSNTPDMDESGVLEENNNVFHPISIADVDEYKRLCVEKVEEEAKKGDLFEEAKANAEKDIDQLFKISLGDEYNVVIEWRSAE
ncbi:MAG: DUF4230 domain-containing protein [Coriobacteriaceae bacterium]|nr:DUF4230 domain-containing protein [Coriobacteriaceae bacterium]